MPSIKLLSKELYELIAAGEVIERPASVIKELVENSVDAGAEHITVEIKDGGITYMRVTDDGCGMSFDEVPTAFLRHATSKINSKDDLDEIYTLGFRGEALASVTAVSKVEVMTKQKNDEYGTLYHTEGGEKILHEKSGCPDGTTIIVRDLFYNVPARAKFLKKDVTEANTVYQILQKIAVSHPEISFKLIRNNSAVFTSSGDGKLYSAIYSVFGKDFANDLIPLDYEYNNIRISGYTIKPLYSKGNRIFQNFFVNGRYVRSKLCAAALENAYTNMVMSGKFPACVMMIELSASNMDVNIHPSKAEVRFTNEKDISDAIFFAVKNAFVKNGLIYEFDMKPAQNYTKPAETPRNFTQMILTPVSEIEDKEKEIAEHDRLYGTELKPPVKEVYDPKNDRTFYRTSSAPPRDNVAAKRHSEIQNDVRPDEIHENISETQIHENLNRTVQTEPENSYKYITENIINQPPQEDIKPYENEPPFETEFPDIKVIGEAFGLYVICESGNKLIMIDKHAAHERIIFERLKSRNCRQYCQNLLTPVKLMLTSEETDALADNTDMLVDMGFQIDFSDNQLVSITAVPTFAMELDIENIIQEIAVNLILSKHDPKSHALDDILHTVACKAAIKANDKNTHEEMKALAEQVCYNDSIRHCPHGRPVMFTVTKYNIDHQFKRT